MTGPSRDIEILPVTPADVPLILALIRELAEFVGLLSEVQATEESLRETLFGAHPCAEVLLARSDDEVAGFALYFQNYSTFLAKPGLYLEDLYVRAPFRGRGVGSALLRHLARIAVERGCGRFEWAVLAWNRRAIDFYHGLGARLEEDSRIFRLSGDALMKLGR